MRGENYINGDTSMCTVTVYSKSTSRPAWLVDPFDLTGQLPVQFHKSRRKAEELHLLKAQFCPWCWSGWSTLHETAKRSN